MKYHSDEGLTYMEIQARCSVCKKPFWENWIKYDVAMKLKLGLSCIECDPQAAENAWYLLTLKGQAESQ